MGTNQDGDGIYKLGPMSDLYCAETFEISEDMIRKTRINYFGQLFSMNFDRLTKEISTCFIEIRIKTSE